MKRLLNITLIAALTLFTAQATMAQQTWEWEAYKVMIDLPDDFEIVKNTDNEFEAEGEGMDIFMYIFEEDISLAEMKDATVLVASEMDLEEYDAVESISTRGYEGKYVAGYLEGQAVLLAGLINPNNVTNFFVVITFNDDDRVAEDDAFRILRSIRKSN